MKYPIVYIYFLCDGCLDCLQISAITTNAAMNILTRVPLWASGFFWRGTAEYSKENIYLIWLSIARWLSRIHTIQTLITVATSPLTQHHKLPAFCQSRKYNGICFCCLVSFLSLPPRLSIFSYANWPFGLSPLECLFCCCCCYLDLHSPFLSVEVLICLFVFFPYVSTY